MEHEIPVFCGFIQSEDSSISVSSDAFDDLNEIFLIRKTFLQERNLLDSESILYEPFVFNTLGEYDYFVFSLVSDFNFSARYFNQYWLDQNGNNSSQILNHSHSHLCTIKNSNIEQSINQLQNSISSNPLIGIIQIKIHNRVILNSPKKIREKLLKVLLTDDLEIVILKAYSWNEYTVLGFSNSFQKLTDLINTINSLKVRDLFDKFNDQEVLELQLIIKTESILGFNSKIIFSKDELRNKIFDNIISSDEVNYFMTGSFLKGAHMDISSKMNTEFDFSYWISGKQDIVTLNTNNNSVPVKQSSQHIVSQIIQNWRKEYAKFIKFESKILGTIGDCGLKNDSAFFLRNYTAYKIPNKIIIELTDKLEKRMVTIPQRDILINLIYALNRYLKDPLTQLSFIEMSKNVLANIEYIIKLINSTEENITQLNSYLYHFSYALKGGIENRLQCSYYTRQHADTYTLFQGGLQMQIHCFEAFMNTLLELFNLPRTQIICIDYREGVSISDNALRLNYFHIYQPEKLISTICCEIAQDLVNHKFYMDNDLFKFCYSSNKTSKSGIEKFDDYLADYLGSLTKTALTEYKKEFFPIHNKINIDFFNHVIGDLFNYKIAYDSDFKVYKFWYWLNFLLIRNAYINEDIFESKVFLKFIIRYQLSHKIIFSNFDETWFNLFPELNIDQSRILNSKAKEYLKILSYSNGINDWIENAYSQLSIIVDNLHKGSQFIEVINNLEQNPFSILKKIYERQALSNHKSFSPSYEGGIKTNSYADTKFLFHERMDTYENIFKYLTIPRLASICLN